MCNMRRKNKHKSVHMPCECCIIGKSTQRNPIWPPLAPAPPTEGGGQHQFFIILRVPEMEKEKPHLHEILKMFIIITTTIIITMLIESGIAIIVTGINEQAMP